MTGGAGRLPEAVVACPVRAAAAVVRWVVGREMWDRAVEIRRDPQAVFEEELAAWPIPGVDSSCD